MLKWIVFVALLLVKNVYAGEELIWISDTPPIASTNEQYEKNINVDGSTMELIFSLLSPHYEIIKLQGNFNRSINILKTKPNVCTGNKVITNERKEYSHVTSIPQVVFPGLRLYINQNSKYYPPIKKLINSSNQISIKKILKFIKEAKFAVVGGRQYGKDIDLLINKPEWNHRFWHRNASDMAEGVIKMLELGRIDLIIEYPNVLSHYQSKDKQATKVMSFSIAESQPYMLGNIICSKSDIGLQLVNKFNEIIQKLSKKREYFDAHMRWFDNSTKGDAVNFYNSVYGTDFH